MWPRRFGICRSCSTSPLPRKWNYLGNTALPKPVLPDLPSSPQVIVLEGEAPPGFEPGMADLQSAASAAQGETSQGVSERQAPRLLAGCSTLADLPPELARLVDAWPKLPGHVRQAILTLADGCQ